MAISPKTGALKLVSILQLSPALSAVVVQIMASLLAWILTNSLLTINLGIKPIIWLISQISFALLLCYLLRQPRWWYAIHSLFMPCIVLALWWDISPQWYLAAFVIGALLFGRVYQHRVPLYLSNQAALSTLSSLLAPLATGSRVLDMGAGTGTVLSYLSRQNTQRTNPLTLVGIEQAWLPWLLARCRLWWVEGSSGQTSIIRADMMTSDLSSYNVVYAFLSPAVMPALWLKAKKEMRPGSLLISNSFAVPNMPADEVIELNDWKGAKFYLWRMT